MKKFKKFFALLLIVSFVSFGSFGRLSTPNVAIAATDVTGSYNLDFTCVTGWVGCAGTVFPHLMNITTEDASGNLGGAGSSVSDPSTTWALTGNTSGSNVTIHIAYNANSYTMDLVGTIAPNGSLSGTASDNGDHTFTWTAKEIKVNICHKDGNSNNWSVVNVSSNGWNGHSNHVDDYLYAGPIDNHGHGDKNWCKTNVPNNATLSATKIVCNSEADLPNWGAGGANITSTTASSFLANHPNCHLQEGWNFQWAPNSAANPGNNIEVAGAPWTAFGPTNASGVVTATVPAGNSLWVREELKPDYIPFSGATSNLNSTNAKNSAEIYCNTDVLNYDNYDATGTLQKNHTYYCVAFNALKELEQPKTITVTATKIVCDNEASLPNWGAGSNNPPFEINSSTATDWLAQHPTCHAQSDWNFQYGNQDTSAPADTLVGLAPGYTSFGPTGVDGTTTVNIPITGVTEVHLAEVLKDGYIPFTAQTTPNNGDDVSAEIYCSSDVYNYDNYEGIGADEDTAKIVPGAHYYCVAWNALKPVQIIDVCPNIPEVQAEIPQGMHKNEAGDCVQNEAPVDVCPNIAGDQATVPVGMHKEDNEIGNCVPDQTQCGDQTLDVVSDDSNMIDGVAATPIGSPNGAWTSISGASWVWNNLLDFLGGTSQTKTISKSFTVVGNPTSATLEVAADNAFVGTINGNGGGVIADATEFNYGASKTYNDVLQYITTGINNISFDVTNFPVEGSDFNSNPAGLIYKLHVVSNDCPPENSTTGTLIVKKELVNSEVNKSTFSFKVDGAESATAFESDGQNNITVSAGTHTVVETTYANYTPAYDNCTDVNVPAGGEATCTITNTYIPPAEDTHVCSDNLDNDQDGLKDSEDPGCHSDHNVNNPDSYNPKGDSEAYEAPVCSDGKDNDQDTLIDSNDPGCHTDGNAGNSGSWNPNGASETDGNNGGGGGGNGGGGNGGGGGGGSSGIIPNFSAPQGQVLGATTSCGIYIDKFLRKGYKNDTDAVKKLQTFLNDYMQAGLKVDGNFGLTTEKALKKFQSRQSGRVLNPWGFKAPTGIFYLTTQTEVNNIMCPDLKLPIPVLTPIETNPAAPRK